METESSDKSNKMAFVIGYTGETGKSLIQELNRTKLFKKIVLIGRREVQLDKDLGPEFEQKVVDFERLTEHKDTFQGLDTGFCCLGTTKGKAGKAGFIKVDHDYVVNSAEVAKSVGCKHFLLVSSYGAKKDSFFLYPKTKGEVEDELKSINFDNLSIFRPGLLLCDREESRPGESCFRCCWKPMPQCIVKASAISTDNLAKAMVYKATYPSEKEQRVVDFERLNDHKDTFEGLDTGFCCIGTTRGKAGKDGFIKVDHDYVVNSAEVAKSVGCKHFLLVTAYGANKDSLFLYPKTKGKVEEELKALDFDRLSIFRPGMLLCDRQESRPGESVLRFCFKAMPNFVIKATAISTDNLAKAMVNRVSEQSSEKIEIIENKQLYDFFMKSNLRAES
ncbi:HTATIP2 [Mytilus coruscus]|uniref:Protein HTATIP2 n=1 Tax=Mytilus coruscus TaxID=42192 RepID=A0A6J8E210_MYTCO|nr:HTATIP2 [Mytilus coruscus]